MRALAYALVAWLAAFAIAYAEPYTHAPTQLAFPDDIAGWPRRDIQDYEARQAGLGVSVRYSQSADVWADVFIYTAGVADVPSDATSPVVRQMRQQTDRDIFTAAKARGYEVRRGESRTVTVATAKGPVSVLYDSYAIAANQRFENTFVWLWASRKHFLKIRMTRRPGEHDPRSVRELYESVVRLSVE
jgi:hypothetical protein